MEQSADGKVRITRDVVEKVLSLKKVDLPTKKIAKLIGISQCSVSQIKAAGSWEGWLQFRKASAELAKTRYAAREAKQREVVEAWDKAADTSTTFNEELIEQLKEINLKLDQLISIQTNTMPNFKNNKPF